MGTTGNIGEVTGRIGWKQDNHRCFQNVSHNVNTEQILNTLFTSLLGSRFLILVCWSKTIKMKCICCYFLFFFCRIVSPAFELYRNSKFWIKCNLVKSSKLQTVINFAILHDAITKNNKTLKSKRLMFWTSMYIKWGSVCLNPDSM